MMTAQLLVLIIVMMTTMVMTVMTVIMTTMVMTVIMTVKKLDDRRVSWLAADSWQATTDYENCLCCFNLQQQ